MTFETIGAVASHATNIGLLLLSLGSPRSTKGASVAVFVKMLQYIKYLNVTYSENLKEAMRY